VAGENVRRHGEPAEWQQVIGRVQELLAASARQQVTWANRDPFVLAPAAGVETGRVACFGKGEDGTPLLGSDAGVGRPLEPVLAEAVARCIALSGRR